MRRRMTMLAGLAMAAGLAGGAPAASPVAQWPSPQLADPYGAAAIQDGRYAAVARRLDAAFARGDRSPEVLLNLAAIHLREGQPGAAQDLYRLILQQPDANMATLTGSAWSHAIARRGLAGTAMAAR